MIKTRTELQEYRESCIGGLNAQKCRILICAGTGCVAGGSIDIYNRIIELCKEQGLDTQVRYSDTFAFCHKG